jgi:hypothetical protein
MARRFQKTVRIKTVDEDARTATGAVLVPDELDRQGDFLRPEAVARFHSDAVDTGVMHAAFPDGAAELTRNEVLDTAEDLGGAEYPPGTWVATRRYEDDDLWQLVADGVLRGFSIGGEIEDAVDHETPPDDVRVPEDVSDETAAGPVTELLDGTVDEVSDVDIPAVPRATYKGDGLAKNVLEEAEDEAAFVAMMTEQRGHSESEARRLYQYLTDHADTGKAAPLTRAAILRKPFAGFDDWDDCMTTMTEERGHSEDAAERICGSLKEEEEAAAPTGKVEINGTEVDLTLPERVINAAEAVEANREAIPDACGTGVGDRRVRQALGDGLGAEVIREAAAYLDSHADDLTADGPPTDWSEDEWADCGNAQYAKWLYYADWFRSTVNEIDRARGEAETYPTVTNSKNLDDPEFSEGDKVSWEWQGDTVHGRVADIGDEFTVAGNTITGAEGEAVYLIHDWDEAAEAYDTEGTAKPESSLSESTMDMPPVDEADTKTGLFERVKTLLTPGGTGSDDTTSVEAQGGSDTDTETTETTMSDDDTDTSDEPPAWAKSLIDDVEQIDKRVTDIEGDDDDTEDAEKTADDAPEWAADLAEKVESLDERVEAIAKQSGHDSDQLGGADETDDETTKGFTLDPRKAGR